MATLVDLSHEIEDGLITYPGLPGPLISSHLDRATSRARYAPGTEFQIDRISMVGNTGTYLDSPRHRYADGGDLASLSLTSLANLDALPDSGFRFFAVPPKIREFGTFPVRAFAIVP